MMDVPDRATPKEKNPVALTKKYGTKKEFKAAFRASAGSNSGLFRRFKDGESARFRFLEEWEEGVYHYYNNKFQWCSQRKDCVPCAAGERGTSIWLAQALERETGKVQIVQVPKKIAKQLYKRTEDHGTIMDRDYSISRTGATMNDTEYFLDWGDRARFDASRYKLVDIAGAIMQELGLSPDDSDDEEPEDEVPRSAKSRNVRTSKRSRDDDYDDDDADDEDDEEEEDDEPPRKPKKKPLAVKAKPVVKKSISTKRVVRRS
jgi:hypothetical protein